MSEAGAPARSVEAQCPPGETADLTVRDQTVRRLKQPHGILGLGPVNPIDVAGEKP
jgi:hypothetical protein